MTNARVLAVVGCLSLSALACSSQELPQKGHTLKTLPECPSIDITPCDTLEAACQDRLLSLAVCLYGVDQRPNVPIRVVAEQDLKDELADGGDADAKPADDPRTRHFEHAMSELRLISVGDLTDAAMGAEGFVDRIGGFYTNAKDGITLVDRGSPQNDANANATLLHELIHAVQDAEYDFATWDQDGLPEYDPILARRSVVEGQATLYQVRAQLAMEHDTGDISLESTFEQLRASLLERAFDDASPYFGAQTTFPYAHGALLAYRAWQQDGPLYHVAQFGDPPTRTLDVINASYENRDDFKSPALLPPPLPAGYISVDHNTLGAFLLELFAHRNGASAKQAEELGLAWRNDHLWICRSAEDTTGYLWELAFATADGANAFKALAELPSGITIESDKERVFLAGSGTPPEFFLQTGRAFLTAKR